MADLAELVVADAPAWRSWLGDHHAESPGIWLVLAKKGTTSPTSLRYDEALEEALCFGWIDGLKRARDALTFVQRFTPRRPRSQWSQRNVVIAERLESAGRVQPAGAVEIERARADGRWQSAYAGAATATVPADLAAALATDAQAAAAFAGLTSQNRYAIIYRLTTARQPATRARRLARFVEMLARGETLH